MRIKCDSSRVHVDLECSIHKFSLNSAFGKSAFAKIVAADKSCGLNVFVFDREAYYRNVNKYLWGNPANTIWVFERFDIFGSSTIIQLLPCYQDKCILIDCKRNWTECGVAYKVAYSELTEGGIRVYDKGHKV